MCGICGIVHFNNNNNIVTDTVLIKIRDTLVHRGPDDAGIYISQNQKIGLGHRRLSIIDLSPLGRQPMSNEDGTIWIVFNGEIYNYQSLRSHLIRTGHQFKSQTDTEVIIHLYEEKGIDCVKDLKGEFAFAIYDERKQCLFFVRDPIGVKPFYYGIINNMIIFSSEIKGILAYENFPRRVNEDALFEFLSFLTTPAPHTLFEHIFKIPCGTYLEVKPDGSILTTKYWEVLDNITPLANLSESSIAKNLLNQMRETITSYKMSDVPVGIFLSGGIDSSINAILFSEGAREPVNTFTIGYVGENKDYPNEFEYSRNIAHLIKAKTFEKVLTVDEAIDFLQRMVYYQDEPIADPVCVPVYFVAKLARDNGVIVCQVGEGSDELFMGYPRWKLAIFIENLNSFTPKIIKKAGMKILEITHRTDGLPYEGLMRGVSDEPIFWGGAEAFTEMGKKQILSTRLREKFQNASSYNSIKPIRDNFMKKPGEKSALNWMTYLDLNMRLPELLLMRIDKMTMAASVESRVPFLNKDLVVMTMSIPTRIKYKNGILKYILKRAVRGVVPNPIIDRKKQGFGIPIYEWFFSKLGKFAKEKIQNFCERTDYFNKQEVIRLFEKKEYNKLWLLLNFVIWYEVWIEAIDIVLK